MGQRPPMTEVMTGRCIPTRQLQVDRNHTASSRDNITAEGQPLTEVMAGPNNGQSNDNKTPTLLSDFEERANGRAGNEVPADQKHRGMGDKPYTAFSKDDDTAERQTLPRVTATHNTQVVGRQRPREPPLLRILLCIQTLLFISAPFIVTFYSFLSGPEKNEDRTTRQFKDKSATIAALMGGLCAQCVDFVIHVHIGKQPLLKATSYREWAMEVARFIAHYYFAFMYMTIFSGVYGGWKGHTESLSGTNGTVWTNGTGGVQKTIGF